MFTRPARLRDNVYLVYDSCGMAIYCLVSNNK